MPRGRDHMRPPAYSARRPHLVRPARVDRDGVTGPTPRQARGPRWRPIGGGYFLPQDVDRSDPLQRVLEAAMLLPDFGMVAGWGALAWLGARWFDGLDHAGNDRPVDLVVPNHQIRPPRGAIVTSERFRPDERFIHDGLCIAEPLAAVSYEMRRAACLDDAVRVLDMAAYDDLVSIQEMQDYAIQGLNGWTGIGQLRDALPLADENAWSPTEVDMRLLLGRSARLTGLLTNRPVFDLSGLLVGTPDLLDVEAGVAIEYDGSLHLAGRQRGVDLRREADFRRVGLEYVTMVAVDRRDPTAFIRRVLEARDRARTQGFRGWTLEPPSWWIPTVTVAQRRALSQADRRRLLRHRAA